MYSFCIPILFLENNTGVEISLIAFESYVVESVNFLLQSLKNRLKKTLILN